MKIAKYGLDNWVELRETLYQIVCMYLKEAMTDEGGYHLA